MPDATGRVPGSWTSGDARLDDYLNPALRGYDVSRHLPKEETLANSMLSVLMVTGKEEFRGLHVVMELGDRVASASSFESSKSLVLWRGTLLVR